MIAELFFLAMSHLSCGNLSAFLEEAGHIFSRNFRLKGKSPATGYRVDSYIVQDYQKVVNRGRNKISTAKSPRPRLYIIGQ